MAVESFVRIVTTVFETNCNSSQLAVPWSISAMFLKSQLYDINVIAHIGPPYNVKWLSTVFDKIEKLDKWLFLGQFRLFLESQPYDVDLIAHIGPP